jgi:hypothetical protein
LELTMSNIIPITELEDQLDEHGLTRMQKAWADAYVKHGNGRRASREAEYAESVWDVMALANRKNPKIRAYMDDCFTELSMGAKEVIQRLTEIAMLDIAEVVLPSGTIDMKKVKELGLDRHIKQTGFDSNGNLKVEFYDRHAALKDLGRVHKLFGDSNTISGAGGGPAVVEVHFVNPPEPTSDDAA